MSKQHTEQKEQDKKGFWASLSFTDYLELLVYTAVAAAVIYEAINYFT
jgi:hypothetical protein